MEQKMSVIQLENTVSSNSDEDNEKKMIRSADQEMTKHTTVIHLNELFMKPDPEKKHMLAKYIRLISATETYVINFTEIMNSVRHDEYSLERQFYKRANHYKNVEGEFLIERDGKVVTVPKKSDPCSDMVFFLSLFLNRGSYVDVAATTKDPVWNEIVNYKKKQYKIKNLLIQNEKPGQLSLAKLASCKPQVITYLCHLNCARLFVKLDFLGEVPKCMQHLYFPGVVPKAQSCQSILYYCYLFTLLWFRKVMKYPQKDVEKDKIEDFVRTCHSGYLDHIERIIIMHSLKLIDKGRPSKLVNEIAQRSKLCWKLIDLFDENREIFLDLLETVPNWLSVNQQVKWIRNHTKWTEAKSECSPKKCSSGTSLGSDIKIEDIYLSE